MTRCHEKISHSALFSTKTKKKISLKVKTLHYSSCLELQYDFEDDERKIMIEAIHNPK